VTRVLTVAVLIAIVSACGSPAASPRPSLSPSVVVVTSPTPTPTRAPTTPPPAPTPAGRYVNPILGFTVTLPAPWRVSECVSRVELHDPVRLGQDGFTWRSTTEEQDLGVSGGTGFTGAYAWIVLIEAEVSSQTAAARPGAGQGVATTIDGKPAIQLNDGAGKAQTFYVANAGRMYTITLTPGFDARPSIVTDETFNAIARSITFVTPAPRPTPTPAPALVPGIEVVADAVAAAFAASDADRLRDLMPPRCWFNYGYYQSEGGAVGRDKFAAGLKTLFAQGLKVTVEPRPIKPDPPVAGSFWIWSTWSGYGTPPQTTPQSNVQLALGQIDGRWYWVGALYNAAR